MAAGPADPPPVRRDPAAPLDLLRQDGVPLSAKAEAVPLTGGVSSEIYLVRDGGTKFVFKRALARLKVADDWRSDPARNRHEQRYLRYVGAAFPRAVPRWLFGSEPGGYFAMEYLGDGFTNWKTQLLRGACDPRWAGEAMSLLAQIHAKSRGQPALAREFDTTENFHQLRTDPYLLTTGRRHPALAAFFEEEAARLERTRECLVHGDFSPKNILLGANRLVVLDCEVAWYGDPAFDVAFLLNHFCLKALYHAPREPGLRALFDTAVTVYFENAKLSSPRDAAAFDHRCARLLLMIMLARVDGKSPVEYLGDEEKTALVRQFVSVALPGFHGSLHEAGSLWFGQLTRRFGSS